MVSSLNCCRIRKDNRRRRGLFPDPKVGAALLTSDGTVVTGCNIENATYGLTLCAERVAMFTALAAGHRRFSRIAVVADTIAPTPPCGPCRQILWEFAGDLEIVLANLRRETGRHRLSDLLPLPFDRRLLRDDVRQPQSHRDHGGRTERFVGQHQLNVLCVLWILRVSVVDVRDQAKVGKIEGLCSRQSSGVTTPS